MATTSFEVGINTLTDVTAISNIALDVRDMAINLKAGDLLSAQRVYTQGANSALYDIYGQETLDKLTLKSMGQAGGSEWVDDPSFTFQMLGLSSVQDSVDEAVS